MKANNNFDVIVIGAGVIGLSVAYYLGRLGVRVLIVERNFISTGTSGACQSNILVSMDPPGPLGKLSRASLQEFKRINSDLSTDFEFVDRGSLLLLDDEAQVDMARSLAAKQNAAGWHVRYLTTKDIMENIAPISEKLHGGIFCAEDAAINCLYFSNALRSEVLHHGCTIVFREEVKEIQTAKDHTFTVRTNSAVYSAKNLVNSAGIYSPAIAEMVGETLPVIPVKGHVLVTERSTNVTLPMPIREIRDIIEGTTENAEHDKHKSVFVIQPTCSGNCLIGKSEEIGNSDKTVSVKMLKMIAKRAMKFIPLLGELNVIRSYCGFRPRCMDDKPVIGESVLNKGLYYATGHGGSGMTLGPITGKVISQLIMDGTTEYDIEEFSPARFVKTN